MEKEFRTGIVIGHNWKEPGAYSDYFDENEFHFWKDYTHRLLMPVGEVFYHTDNSSYSGRQAQMADRTKDMDLVFELHFNSFNTKAGGSEVVIYKGNKITKELGELFISKMGLYMGYDKRSVKEVDRDTDRGYGFLQKTKGNAIILEPFFGDNDSDCKKFSSWRFRNILEEVIYKAKTI